MAIYDEMASGGAVITGCALLKFYDIIVTQYGTGDILYNLKKAKHGTLEKIVIKYPRLANLKKSQNQITIIYVDTFNGLWNENELIPLSQAVQYAEDYWLQALEKLKRNGVC
jgi:hypothetical protein